MGGIRIGGRIQLGRRPNIPWLADNNDGSYAIWQFENLADPRGMTITNVSTGSGNYLGDPEASPVLDADDIPTQFVYNYIAAGSGTFNEIRVSDWEGTAETVIAQPANGHVYPGTGANGFSISSEPSWNSTGDLIVYKDWHRQVPGSTTNLLIDHDLRTVEPDGSNDTLIYTCTNHNGGDVSDYEIYAPLFNYDGSKLAWVEEQNTGGSTRRYSIHTANADGSGHAMIHHPVFPHGMSRDGVSWANASNTIAFLEQDDRRAAFFTVDSHWKTINYDGTGLTTIWDIDRALYPSAAWGDTAAIKWSWLSDDSAIVTTLLDTVTEFYRLSLIDAGGGGVTDLGEDLFWWASDYRPAVMMARPTALGALEPRIFWSVDGDTPDPITQINSMKEDGTDIRIELGPSRGVEFQGFRGDNLDL